MTTIETVCHVLRSFNSLNIPYMMVGSLSLNLYAVPRNTNDADFVVQLGEASLHKLVSALGSEFKLDRQMGFETITSTVQYRIEHSATGFIIELFELTDDPHDQARFGRRKTLSLMGIPTSVPTAEDVLIQKIRWAQTGRRTKDLADAENIATVQKTNLDLTYVRHWCDVHKTRDILEHLLGEN